MIVFELFRYIYVQRWETTDTKFTDVNVYDTFPKIATVKSCGAFMRSKKNFNIINYFTGDYREKKLGHRVRFVCIDSQTKPV